MKIISIEGLDKAGKHTATDVLYNFFKSRNLNVKRFSMPNYDSPFGQMIHQWLKGELKADTKVFELLQAIDKQHAQSLIQEWEDEGTDILLIDRYVHSMWAYGAYDNDRNWLQELTKYMRRPDHTIYLDVEPEVSMHRNGKYGENDRYEADLERLRFTKQEYERLFEEHTDIPVTKIDANQPKPMVQVDLFKVAGVLYTEYTGIKDEQIESMNESLDDFVAKVTGQHALRLDLES